MNSAQFEDAIFIVNMRIRLVRDTLRLNPPTDMFFQRSLDDLEFIGKALAFLAQMLTEGEEQRASSTDYDYASDAEWQFNQLLTELSVESIPFPVVPGEDVRMQIAVLREASDGRRKVFEESGLLSEMARAEPMVSSVELNSLLGSK
jgi:hypothetical protein